MGAKLSPHPNANKDAYRQLKKQLKPCEASNVLNQLNSFITEIIAAVSFSSIFFKTNAFLFLVWSQ